jgi:Family of unknown function (DUF5681)
MTVTSGELQMARWKRGQSGNRTGRPPGSRGKALLLLDQIGQANASGVLDAMIRQARSGDVAAGSLLMSRCWPARRGRPVQFTVPPLNTINDVVSAISAITEQVSGGRLSPEEGVMICELIKVHRKALETLALEARVAALEIAASKC